MIEEKLPDIFKKHAYHPNHFIYAFRRGNLEKLFEELLRSNIAIKGGEVWVVEDEIVENLIPLENGQIEIFNWEEKIKDGEEWYDFVERSVKESMNQINSWNLEKRVRLDKANKVWYHFKFEEE